LEGLERSGEFGKTVEGVLGMNFWGKILMFVDF
jgi:hypothetical protein